MAKRISSAAPSTLALLRECPYRVALRQESQWRGRSTPWARLGTACHAILAAALRGNLDVTVFDAAFEAAWDCAVATQAEAARLDPVESLWGTPERWPSYSERKLRTKRLAQWLAQERTVWQDADLAIEERLESSDGRIFGTPDLVVRQPAPHRVEDYKTGGVLDDDGVLAERYRRQILIYSHLEHDTNGALPSIGVVRRLRGDPITFAVTEGAVKAEVEDALGAIDDFNASLSDPEGQARPSGRVCRACPYAARCEPFWQAAPSMDPADIVALGGELTALHSTDAQGLAVHLKVTEGNMGVQEASIRGIQRPLAPTLGSAELSAHVRIVGLKPVGSTEQSFAPRGMLRIQTQAGPS